MISRSESVLGSLCQEVDGIRQRCLQLQLALPTCQNTRVHARMLHAYRQLQQRQQQVLTTAQFWRKQGWIHDLLALDFLIEICSRSPNHSPHDNR